LSQVTQILSQIHSSDPSALQQLLPLVHEALRRLAAAKVVQLRSFAGLRHQQIAEFLGVSTITIQRHWRYARAWLIRKMKMRGVRTASKPSVETSIILKNRDARRSQMAH
jgi:DNA-directed RNA polymerase specialized sigma24 family protein